LDLTSAKRGNLPVWTVVTRRNCEDFPPFRVDEFSTKDEAIKFIEEVEPTTPLISLDGKSPFTPLPYIEYCKKLKQGGVPSSLEIHEMNKAAQRQIILEDLNGEDKGT
jgi:hypothetical protein